VPWRKVLAWSGLVLAAAVVVAAAVYAVFWPLSDLIARHDVGPIIEPHRVAALQRCHRDAAATRIPEAVKRTALIRLTPGQVENALGAGALDPPRAA
jgi:hypothetical protein